MVVLITKYTKDNFAHDISRPVVCFSCERAFILNDFVPLNSVFYAPVNINVLSDISLVSVESFCRVLELILFLNESQDQSSSIKLQPHRIKLVPQS